MREIVVISGKGGTGKTSITAALAQLSENTVICDLDVDAPDLHILLDPEVRERHEFVSGFEARIDTDACTACGTCRDVCRFEAVAEGEEGEEAFRIDPIRCEGCKVCVALCPVGAIEFTPRTCGEWYLSGTKFGPMVHAQLHPGEENSGRLVSLLKNRARELAEERGMDTILCDGAPGVGCPVISSLAGIDLAVAVCEPTLSGLHDLKRVGELCEHFRTVLAVIVNKHDLNEDVTSRIEKWCAQKGHRVVAKLPFDEEVTRAMVQRESVLDSVDSPFTRGMRDMWSRISDEFCEREHGREPADTE